MDNDVGFVARTFGHFTAVEEAVKVLDVAAKKFGLKLNYTSYDIGGDRYLRTGEVLPDTVLLVSVTAPWSRLEMPPPTNA